MFIPALWTFLFIHKTFAAPSCTEPYSHLEVAEDTPIETVVKEIMCSPSGTGSLTYVIRDGNTHGKFGINTVDGKGQVFVYQSISFESRVTEFQLTISVSESEPYVTSTNYVLDIAITGVNDYAPLFLFSPYTVYVNEDKPPGSIISTPIPYDFDKGEDGITTSEIIEGDKRLFYMDPQSARVYLRSLLDYELQTEYTLIIQVTDNGLPTRRSSTTMLTVHVKDKNDNPPVCEEPYISETFDEAKPAESVIKLLKCTDIDDGNNGRLSFSIESGDYTKFRLQGPYLLLAEMIDVDTEPSTWTLSIMVQDRGTPHLSTVVDVVIYVEGVDDNVPQWAPPEYGQYVVDIEEHSSVGTHVVQLSAHDADENGQDAGVLYYMDEFTHMFTLKPTTGEIFVNADIDREVQETFVLRISAVSRNNRLQRVTTDVTINVIDVNDNAPVFSADVMQFYIPEDFPRLNIIRTFTAYDADTGSNGNLRYRIVDGDQAIFDLTGHTGELMLHRSLDYESVTLHVLTIEVTDTGRPQRSATASIILSVLPVNEFSPVFKDIGQLSISENVQPGTSLFQIRASDADAGMDGVVNFKVLSANERFVVESSTGIVRLVTALDRETKSEYQLTFLAEDNSETARQSSTMSVTVSILDENDHAPECQFMYFVNISNIFSSGYEVLRLNCTDKDVGLNALLIYRVTSGNSQSDFLITDNGVIQAVKKLSQMEYRLQITVSDAGSPSLQTETIVIISVQGKPSFSNLPKIISLSESTPLGTLLYEITTSGTLNKQEFSIESINDIPTIKDWPIRIDKVTGRIYLFQYLDREKVETHSIDINVTDLLSGLSENAKLEIIVTDENDNIPEFGRTVYNVSVVENVRVGTELLQVTAIDKDFGRNGDINFDISGPNADDLFFINKYGSIIINGKLDREQMSLVILVITATDNGESIRNTGTCTVVISIVGVDEYNPEFVNINDNFEIQLSEDTPLGTTVMTITARDLDVGSKVIYSINNNSYSGHFIIGKTSGDLVLFKLLDRETRDFLSVSLSAQTNDKIVTGTLKIIVLDENDNAPQFISNVFNFMVHEQAMPRDIVGEIEVYDNDSDENGDISLGIVQGNVQNKFVLLGKSLHLNDHLEYAMNDKYLLTIEARDSGNPSRTSSALVIILVMPEYKQPKFISSHEIIEVPENMHIGQRIYDADATLLDAREDSDGDLMYDMATTIRDTCMIDPRTGQITLINALHTDSVNTEIIFQIVAKNIYNPNLRDTMILKVDIIDTNDHKPEFEKNVFAFSVKENNKPGTIIGQVVAKDEDSGRNAEIEYQIKGSGDNIFEINGRQGTISFRSYLDYEKKREFSFIVVAVDHGEPSLSGSAYVHIQVEDVNDNRPVFNEDECKIQILEDTPINSTIYQFRATDEDSGFNGDIQYRINNGVSSVFRIDSETGTLILAENVDRETADSYSVSVTADDKGSPTLSSSLVCLITIVDVNDNAPVFVSKNYSVSIPRHVPVGTVISTVSAYDLDEAQNSKVIYRFSDKTGDDHLRINQLSGEILTSTDLTTAEDHLRLYVLAYDQGTPRLSSTATISVDVYPSKHVQKDFTFSLSEQALPNTFVGRVGTHSDYRYMIIAGNVNNTFRVIETTGSIFLNKSIDREVLSEYFLVFAYSHKSSENFTAEVTVHVIVLDENDNDPRFIKSHYMFSILQYSPVELTIGQVIAVDNDTGDNAEITYAMDCMDWTHSFKISKKGVITLEKQLKDYFDNAILCTVIATDNGTVPRMGVAEVALTMIKIDPGSTDSSGMASHVISVEMPLGVTEGYVVMTLNPDLFGMNVSSDKVVYLTKNLSNGFNVDRSSGDIRVSGVPSIETSTSLFVWVVAARMDVDHKRSLGLIRIDTFVPRLHVMILTHEVSVEVLAINRESYLNTLQGLFPTGRVTVWKLESDSVPTRRKLLYRSSRSYIYVVKDSTVDSLDGIEMSKQYLTQNELSEVLMVENGDISEKLTNKQFDNFTIIQVQVFSDDLGNPSDNDTDAIPGPIVIGTIMAVIALLVLALAVCLAFKKKWNKAACSPLKGLPFNQIQSASDIESNTGNSIMRKSSNRFVPSATALKLIECLTENEKQELMKRATFAGKFETTRSAKLSSQTLEKVDVTENTTNTDISVDQGRTAYSQMVKDKWRCTTNKVVEHVQATINGEPNSWQPSEVSAESFEEQMPPRLVPPTGANASLSPLVAKAKDPLAKPIIGLANRTIVIGGKEYNGVGKDTISNQKYFYNTRTGDKLLVTDDILRRAIEQRQSVIGPEFDQNRNKVRFSTFKRPIKRKMSRTRFSTTTIWEMSIDEENEDEERAGDKHDGDKGPETFLDSEKQRKLGIDNPEEINTFKNERDDSNMSDIDTDVVTKHDKIIAHENPIDKKHKRKLSPCIREVAASVGQELLSPRLTSSRDTTFESMSTITGDDERDKEVFHDSSEDVFDETSMHEDEDSANIIEMTHISKTPQDDAEDKHPNAWLKAGKYIRFARPLYKPLNLENVQCKIPKGKSDPKDCLAKDPIYVGWAKVVGRKASKKTGKRKEDRTKMPKDTLEVMDPPDLSAYTKAVANLTPPHFIGRPLFSRRISDDSDPQ